MAVELASAYISLVPSTRGLGKSIVDDFGKSGKQAQASFGSKFSGLLGKTIKRGAVGVAAAASGTLGAALFKGFNRLNNIDKATAKLKGLGNSTKTVDKIMANALSSVKGTAFGLDEAATTAGAVVAAGVKPGKDLQKVLGTVADTATIAGTSMSDMGQIFGSVAARGKLQGDDMMQLTSKGVPVLSILAKHYGITAKAASKMVSDGKVDFKNFSQAMNQSLGGAAKKSGDTFSGALSNMGAALSRVGANLLKGVFPQLQGLFGDLTGNLDSIGPAAEKVGAAIGKAMSVAVTFVKDKLIPAVQTFATAALPKIEAFGGFITSSVVPAIKSVIDFMVKWQNVLLPVAAGIGTIVAAFQTYKLIMTVAKAATAAFSVVQAALNVIMSANPIGIVILAVAGLVAGLVVAYKKSETFRKVVNAVWSAVKKAIAGTIGWFTNTAWPTFRKILTAIGNANDAVWNTISRVWNAIKSTVSGAVRAVRSAVTTAWNAVKSTTSSLWNGVKSAISNAINTAKTTVSTAIGRIKSAVKDGFGTVVATAKSLPGKIVSALSGMSARMRSVGVNMIQGLIGGIRDMAGQVAQKAKEVVQGAIDAAKNLLHIHSPSRVFAEIGQQTGAGMVLGMDRMHTAVSSAARSMAGAAIVPAGDTELGSINGSRHGAGAGVTIVAEPGSVMDSQFARMVGEVVTHRDRSARLRANLVGV